MARCLTSTLIAMKTFMNPNHSLFRGLRRVLFAIIIPFFAAMIGVVLGAAPPAHPQSSTLPTRLMLYFPFDVEEGATVQDAAGGFHGTKQRGGPSIVPGRFARAARFSGGENNTTSAHYLDLSAHAGAFSGFGGGTISAWIKPETNHTQDVLTIFAASDKDDGSSELRFFVSNGGAFGRGRLVYQTRNDGDGPAAITSGVDDELLDGRWHHVAVVANPRVGQAILYIDGVRVASGSVGFTDQVQDLDTMALGRNLDNGMPNGQWFYDGMIDEFAIWNDALSESDILALSGANVVLPPRQDSVLGNAVDASTGEFLQGFSAMRVEGIRVVDFSLLYNARHTAEPGALGSGWSHRFEARLEERRGMVSIWWTPNQRNRFEEEDGEYVPLDEAVRYARLRRDSNQHWVLREQDGTRWEFDKESGQLRNVANKIGQRITLDYSHDDPSLLTTVLSIGGNLELDYDAAGRLTKLSDAMGREVWFRYDGQDRLAAVTDPFIPDAGDGVEIGDSFPPKDIPDSGELVHTIFAGDVGVVEEITLENTIIGHMRADDLTVTLVSPAGTEVVLDDPTISTIMTFDGQVLDDFQGELGNGVWQVIIRDDVPGETGELSGWQMRTSRGIFNETRYFYDEPGRIVRAEDIRGEPLYANTYDAAGRVATQDDALTSSPESQFAYRELDGGGLETTYTNRAGDAYVTEHDAASRLVRAIDPLGNTQNFQYTPGGDRTHYSDALGNTYLFEYTEADSPEFGHLPGYLASISDPAGHQTTFIYDRRYNEPNNPNEAGVIVGSPAGNLVRILDAQRRSTTFNYDQFTNNVVAVIDGLNQGDTKSYNANGQMDGNSRGGTSGVQYMHDANGNVSGITHATGGSTSVTYDGIGRLIMFRDPDGYRSRTAYSSTGKIIEQTDGLGQAVRSVYDYRGRLVRKIDRNGNPTDFTYDNNDNLLTIVNALGEVTTHSYDHEDRLVATTDARGNSRSFTYDAASRLVAHSDALGNTTRRHYDATGKFTGITDPEGIRAVELTYDSRGNPIASRDAFGHSTTAQFDEVGQVVEVVDPLGNRTAFEYDRLGRPEQVTAPDDRIAMQDFTSDDRIKTMTNDAGRSTSFTYDAANRLKSITTALGNQTQLTYNGRDFVASETFPSSKGVNYVYDGAGRLSELQIGFDFVRHYDYDANGNLLTVATQTGPVAEPEVQISRTYDALDRMTSFTDAEGNTIRQEYDAAGNVSRLVYPDGKAVDYAYDAADRLIKVTDWAGRVTRYRYDRNSRVIGIDFPNGASRLLTYDAAGQVRARVDLGAAGQVITHFEYGYNAGGHMEVENALHPTTPYVPTATSMSFDADNRMTAYNGEAVAFDADGNMTSGLGFQSLSYDDFNKLLIANGTENYRYHYDQEDRLVGWEVDNQRTHLVVNPGHRLSQVLMKTDPDGTVTRYVYGIGLIYQETGGQTKTFHYDHRGSTVALSDDAGAVAGRINYGSFGEIGQRSGDTDTIFLFNGLFGVIESPQGLKYMRFRWYVAEARRFLNQDAHFGSIGSLVTLNRYVYAGNNPITRIDPHGEFGQIVTAAIGALVGAAADTVATFVVDVLDDGKINTPWEDYVGAAVGGAVSGAIIGGTGCIPCGGAAGSAVEYLTAQGLKGEKVDPAALALVTGIGAAVSVSGGEVVERQTAKLLTKKLLAKEFAQDVVEGVVGNLLTAAALDVQESARDDLSPGSRAATGPTAVGHSDVFRRAQNNLNRGNRNKYGEYAHWQSFLDALGIASRPRPNNPNKFMTGY